MPAKLLDRFPSIRSFRDQPHVRLEGKERSDPAPKYGVVIHSLVLFWSLDRFSREGVLEMLQHLQRLSSHGVEWFSYREEYLRSIGIFKDAVLAILACIAKQERVRLSERVQACRSLVGNSGRVERMDPMTHARAYYWRNAERIIAPIVAHRGKDSRSCIP